MKKLIGSQVPDINGLWVEANLSERLCWCGLQGLVRTV
jgi:hypothetical protein